MPTTTETLHLAWVVAAAAVAVPLIFTKADLLVTVAHEAGHAAASLVFGTGFQGIHINADGTGHTHATARSVVGAIPIGLVGYAAPSATGLLIAWGYTTGRTVPVLIAITVVVGVLTVMSRNVFGFILSAVLGALAVWTITSAAPFAQALAVLFLAWFLLLGGTWDAVTCLAAPGTDHETLRDWTGVPTIVWAVITAAVSVWCLYLGGRILLGI